MQGTAGPDDCDDSELTTFGCKTSRTLIGRLSHPNSSWKNVVFKKRRSSRDAVLLLFTPDTYRFELLALQSIHEKARVADLLDHILNCQDDKLRKQTYKGILIAKTEKLLTPEKLVASHCGKRNSIFVAVPEPTNSIVCTRMAIRLLYEPIVEKNVSEQT